jgi:hypothetical protein
MTDTADTTGTASEIRGGFPEIKPLECAPPELGRFVAAMHRLQDLTVSTNPDSSMWTTAAEHSRPPARCWTATRFRKAWHQAVESSNCPGWVIPCYHRGPSRQPERTASACRDTSPDPMWAEITLCTAA